MKKIKMLKTCQAYDDVNKIQNFEKGKEYEVNEFLFNSFTKSCRAVSIESKEAKVEKTVNTKVSPVNEVAVGKSKETEIGEEEEDTEEEFDNDQEDEEESEEDEEDEEDEVDLDTMSKEELKEYCKKLEIPLKGNLSVETMINKINEAQNG